MLAERGMREPPAGRIEQLPYFAVPTLIASITDPVVELAVDVVDSLGLRGVFVLMTLESACIPVPSEATMLFAGFNVSDGEYSLLAAVAVGSVGKPGRLLDRLRGRLLRPRRHPREARQEAPHQAEPPAQWADRWFERHGDATVLLHADAADHPHVHLASCGRRPDAVLALFGLHPDRLRAVGVRRSPSSASRRATTGRSGRTPCTTWTTPWWRQSWSASPISCCAGGATGRRTPRPRPHSQAASIGAGGRWRSDLVLVRPPHENRACHHHLGAGRAPVRDRGPLPR